ncbi:unnamed protein product [Victoria cruziana]
MASLRSYQIEIMIWKQMNGCSYPGILRSSALFSNLGSVFCVRIGVGRDPSPEWQLLEMALFFMTSDS